MTESELKTEHAYRYNERLALLGVFGVPTADQHNLAVLEANQIIIELRKDNSIVAKLRALRESL